MDKGVSHGLQRKGQPADLPRFARIETDDHGFDGLQIDVAPVIHDHLLGAGLQSGLDGKLGHGAGDGGHRSDTHRVRGAGHPPRDLGRIGADRDGLQRMLKMGMPPDIVLQNRPLPDDLLRDGCQTVRSRCGGPLLYG